MKVMKNVIAIFGLTFSICFTTLIIWLESSQYRKM